MNHIFLVEYPSRVGGNKQTDSKTGLKMINKKKLAVLVFGFDIYKPMYMRRRRRPLSHFLPRTLCFFFHPKLLLAGAHISVANSQGRETYWTVCIPAGIHPLKTSFSDRRERRAYSIMKRWCLYLCVHKHTLYTHTVGGENRFHPRFFLFSLFYFFRNIIQHFHFPRRPQSKEEARILYVSAEDHGDSTPLPFTHPGAKTYRWRERAFNKQQNGENEDGGSRTGFHFISRLNR